MRTNALAFLIALVTLALAPALFANDHNSHPSNLNHHDHAAAATHAKPTDADHHNHDGHPHRHTFLQWLHNVLFGHFHHDRDLSAAPAGGAAPLTDHRHGEAGVLVLPRPLHHHDAGEHDTDDNHVDRRDDCTGIR